MDQKQTTSPNNPKQQVIDSLKNSNNILITVSQNPSIDQLSACIGLALLLSKLNKHSTAIFSGTIPSVIEFLQPEKTLESNTDSLRDFIISLDRDKADKLRYKVEDNVVRIFITPYRTSITQDDLVFSQGDYNVDVVVALGVDQREHLDMAIMQQGRILHDAAVIGISVGAAPTNVGAINFHDPNSSSISELVVDISESLKSGLIDSQIATALLTGIVAETDRFKNEKTSAKAMSVSSQLISYGANQQLVAEQLDNNQELSIPQSLPSVTEHTDEKSAVSFNLSPANQEGPKEATVSLHINPFNQELPVEEEPKDEVDGEIKKIKIDEAGQIHDDAPSTNPEDQIINKPHKVIQPPSQQGAMSPSSYIFTPPKWGGTLTAVTQDNPSLELPTPQPVNPQNQQILEHESPLPETPSVTNVSEDDARKAVLTAVSSGPGLRPDPIAALNAQPMDLGSSTGMQNTPPPLPPPITPLTGPSTPSSQTTPPSGNPFNLPPAA